MTNETKQTAVEWLIEQIDDDKFVMFNELRERTKVFTLPNEDIFKQAKEIEVAGKEISYADGYSAGYYRALELVEWKIKHELKIDNK